MNVEKFIDDSNLQNNPIFKIKKFIEKQNQIKLSEDYDNWRYVGGLLTLTYENATIITHDSYKNIVGGIPRGSFLIMVPSKMYKPHFVLLRVKSVTSTPLENQIKETYFELQKKSMPELDKFTQSELQWSALDCDVIGMFYGNPIDVNKLEFSGDINNIVSPHKYEVYSPDKEVLDLIVNGTLNNDNVEIIGKFRPLECLFENYRQDSMDVNVQISMRDFMGKRTAMFGKTRLGKSNVVKIIADNFIKTTKEKKNVGQLIFDINGEYANDNIQDGKSLYSKNEEFCEVYALNPERCNKAKTLKLNFYENTEGCQSIIRNKLMELGKISNYITAYTSVDLPSLESYKELTSYEDKNHYMRQFRIYWSILKKAGFQYDESALIKKLNELGIREPFVEKFNKDIIEKYELTPSNTLDEMAELYFKIAGINNTEKIICKNKPYFNEDEESMLGFLNPKSGSGVSQIKQFRNLHSINASNFESEILDSLDNGKTIILDLGNADDSTRQFFSDRLSIRIFKHQEDRFVNNTLDDKYIQLYFEEAHNLFPKEDSKITGIYSRFAKEGAKFHIGMVYSTQSPSTISPELLIQTENFFVGHLSSSDETKALSKNQIAFSGIEQDILRARTPGYMRMMTMSHRFVIPVQTKEYGKEV